MTKHYRLEAVYGDEKVLDTTVQSHPAVGQTINSKWLVVEILESTSDVYRIRVEPIYAGAAGSMTEI